MKLSDLRWELNYFKFTNGGKESINELKNDKLIEIGWSNSVREYTIRRLKKPHVCIPISAPDTEQTRLV